MNQTKNKEKKSSPATAESYLSRDEHAAIERFRESYENHGITPAIIKTFQGIILSSYKKHGRSLPWRETTDPYSIFVSEIMLQQTQVDRVVDKYCEFISLFPDVESLAHASLQDVLNAWLGLGYNRRALALKKSAAKIVAELSGIFPSSEKDMMELPGVGKYTAAAIAAFAFNQPVVLVETNVRTVFIHFFFNDRQSVSDKDLVPFVEKSLGRSNPRQWYNALMDYGVILKKAFPNPSRKSAHYSKQSQFAGSDRQIRGMILRILAEGRTKREATIIKEMEGKDPSRVKIILQQLWAEGFLERKKGCYALR